MFHGTLVHWGRCPEGRDVGLKLPVLGFERSYCGSVRPNLESERPDLGIYRPAYRSKRLNLEFAKLDL